MYVCPKNHDKIDDTVTKLTDIPAQAAQYALPQTAARLIEVDFLVLGPHLGI